MRPLISIHAGEYLVASEIERRFRRVNVWVPSKDTGVDLLVTDRRGRRTASLQVKFSKDFLVTHGDPESQKQLRACGWWTIDRAKLAQSPADYWVFVLQGFANRTVDFIVVPQRELARRLRSIHGPDKKVHTYLCVTEEGRCWETRGMRKPDQRLLVNGEYANRKRDFTRWLDNWDPIRRLDRGEGGGRLTSGCSRRRPRHTLGQPQTLRLSRGRYTVGLDRGAFLADGKTVDAVARNLEVIGEVANRLHAELRTSHPEIERTRIAGPRIMLDYFGTDVGIV